MDGVYDSSIPLDTQDFDLDDGNDVDQLRQAVLNEKLAPQILSYKHQLVQRIRSKLEEQGEVIETLDGEGGQELGVSLYTEEKARVVWLLKEYLRVRVKKLERHAAFILAEIKDEEDLGVDGGLLSEGEKKFLEEYFLAVGNHLRDTVLRQLPDDYKSLVKSHKEQEERDMMAGPETQRHIFCKVFEDLGRVRTQEDGLEVDMKEGDLYVVRYDFVAHLLQRGSVGLV